MPLTIVSRDTSSSRGNLGPYNRVLRPMNSFRIDTVDSTNDEAKRLIAEGRLRGRGYVLAREQTAGRGTQGRSWLSPRDAGLYLSVARTGVEPPSPNVAQLTLAAGAACVEAIHEWALTDRPSQAHQ